MAITPGDVTDALQSIGIQPGSIVLVHADAIVAAQFPLVPRRQRLDALIETIDMRLVLWEPWQRFILGARLAERTDSLFRIHCPDRINIKVSSGRNS